MLQNIEKILFGVVLLAVLTYVGLSIKTSIDVRRQREAIELQCADIQAALETNTRPPIPADPDAYWGRMLQDWQKLPKVKPLRPAMFYER